MDVVDFVDGFLMFKTLNEPSLEVSFLYSIVLLGQFCEPS